MELMEKLRGLSEKIRQQGPGIKTEEATKNAFVMPFIHNILGYDVFNPNEVTPEFIADVGTKKGEKVDYAILQNSQIQILIECKKFGDPLNINHAFRKRGVRLQFRKQNCSLTPFLFAYVFDHVGRGDSTTACSL